ncbi:MAG: lipocalin family protein [Pseudomonadota bacterium]
MNTVFKRSAIALSALVLMSGCASFGGADRSEIETVSRVDLDRFMGRWYVIAHIPTFIETKAYNAVEAYERRDADTIDTTFSFNKSGFEGKLKTYTPVATVRPDTGDAVWGMQFVWPIKAEYRVIWVDDAYAVTVIGRSKRDYVWIMAREPELDADVRTEIDQFLVAQGYDLSKMREVPQRWDGRDAP